jgi:hypothetical protein
MDVPCPERDHVAECETTSDSLAPSSRALALSAVGWFDAYVAHREVVEVVGEDDCAVDACGSRDERVWGVERSSPASPIGLIATGARRCLAGGVEVHQPIEQDPGTLALRGTHPAFEFGDVDATRAE